MNALVQQRNGSAGGAGGGEGTDLADLDGTTGIDGRGDQWSILSSARDETVVPSSPSVSLRATYFSPYLGPAPRSGRKRVDTAASRLTSLGISHLGTPSLLRTSSASASSLPDDTVLLESSHSFALYACEPATTAAVTALLAAAAADASTSPAYCRTLCGLDSTTYIKLANASLEGPVTLGQARTWAAQGSARYLDRGNSFVYAPVTRVNRANDEGTTTYATASMVVLPSEYDCFAVTDAVSVAPGGRTDRLDPRYRASSDVSLSRQSSLPALHGSALSLTNERCALVLFNQGCILNLEADVMDSVMLGPSYLYHWLERPAPPATPAPTPGAAPTPQPIPPPAVPPGFTRPEVCILRLNERDIAHAHSSTSSIVEAHNCLGYYLRLTVNRGCVNVEEGLSRWGEASPSCPARKRQFEQATGTPWASALAADGEYAELTLSSLSRIELVYIALEDYVPARGDRARLSLLRTSPEVDTYNGAPPPLATDVVYSTVQLSRPLWYASQSVDPVRVRYAPPNVDAADLATDASNDARFEAFQLRIGRRLDGPTVFGVSDLGFYIIDQISVNVSIGDGNFGGMENWWTPGSMNNDSVVGVGNDNMTSSDELDDLLDDVLKNQTDSVDDFLDDLDDAWGNDDTCDGGERALAANETAGICGSDLTDPRDIACFCGDLASALAAAQLANPAVTRIEFGASNGAICSYPPRPANETEVCDARTASWYTQAAYPPHRLVLVIDTMVSDLCSSGRLERAKELGTSLISTLSPRDFGAVVGDYQSGTYTCLRNELVRTTRPHTIGLLERVASLDTCGEVSYTETFGRVFELLRPEEGESSFAACSDLIVFITGNPDSAAELEDVFAAAREREEPAAVNARLFIFTLLPPEGSNSSGTTDRSAYKEILCEQGALGAFINSDGDPLDATDTLFQTLAAENEESGDDGADSSRDITWSADPLSGDLSASQAIYGDAVTGGRQLLGVIRLELSSDVLAAVATRDNSTTVVGTDELESLTDSGLNPERMASLLVEATGGCVNRICYYLDVRGRIIAQVNDPNQAPVDLPFGRASPIVFEDMLAQGLVATRRVVDWEASTNCTRFQVEELRLRSLAQASGYGAVQREFGSVGATCLAGYYAFGRVLEESSLVPKGVAVFLVVINPVGEVRPLGECRAPARVQETCEPFDIVAAADAVCYALETGEDSSSSGSDGSIIGGLLDAVERSEDEDANLNGEAAECRLVKLSQRELDAFRDDDLKCEDAEDTLWLIVGISVAACCCLALIMFLCIFAITKRRREEARANETTTIVVQGDGSGSGGYGSMYAGPSGGMYGEQAGAGGPGYVPSGVSSSGVGYADQAGSDIAYSGQHVGYAEQQAGVAPPARGMYPDAGYAGQQAGVAPEGFGYAGQQAGVAPPSQSQYSGQYADAGYPVGAGAAPDPNLASSARLHESFAMTAALRARRASVTYDNDVSFHDSLDDSLEAPGGVAEYGVALPPEMHGDEGDSTSSSTAAASSSSSSDDQYAVVMPVGLGGGGPPDSSSSSDDESSEYEYETSYSSDEDEDAEPGRVAAGAAGGAAAAGAMGGFAATRYDGSSASYSSSSGGVGSDANAPVAADYADLDGTSAVPIVSDSDTDDDSSSSYSSYLTESDSDEFDSLGAGGAGSLPPAPAADYGMLAPGASPAGVDSDSDSESASASVEPGRPLAVEPMPALDYGDLGPTPRGGGGVIVDSDSDSTSSYSSDSSPEPVHFDSSAVMPADDYGMLDQPGPALQADDSSSSSDSSSSVAGPAVGQPLVQQREVPVASDYGDLVNGGAAGGSVVLDSDSSSSSSVSLAPTAAADYAEVVPTEMRRELSSSESSSYEESDSSDDAPPAVDYADLAARSASDETEVDERLLLSDTDSSSADQVQPEASSAAATSVSAGGRRRRTRK